MKNRAGFTLIELMIVVAVVGILAAIAYPSYVEYVKKGIRADAKSLLMQIASKEQQYFLDARIYANSVDTLGVQVPSSISDNYTITVALGEGVPPSYTATLTGKGRMAGDYTFSINDQGIKTQVDSSSTTTYW